MIRNLIIIFTILIIGFMAYWILKKPNFIYPLPKTAANIDLKKYVGTWYEIALIPNRFEKDCSCTKAIYTLMDGYIKVENSCYKEVKHKYTMVTGKAWSVDTSNSKLKIQFFWPFKGDYWILYVDPDYKYALVGVPSREYLWILARRTNINEKKYISLVSIARQQGFDTKRLVKTVHNCY